MKQRPHIIPSTIAIIFLVGAVFPWPIGYYTLLRFIVCGAAAYVAYLSYECKTVWAMWTFGIMAVLFNPIMKIYLGRELWLLVDVVAAILFIVGIIKVKTNKTTR